MICHCMCATYGSVTSTWKASLFRNWNYSLHVLHFIHSLIMFSYIWKQKECRYLVFTASFNLKMSISAFTYLLQNWMWIQYDEFHQIFFFTHEKKLSKKKVTFYVERRSLLGKWRNIEKKRDPFNPWEPYDTGWVFVPFAFFNNFLFSSFLVFLKRFFKGKK
jgi:hypothetical protein